MADTLFERYFEELGPTHVGAVATTDGAYPELLFGEAIQETVTTSVQFFDMAKFADASLHPSWVGPGTFVKLAPSGIIYIRQRSETSTVTSTSTMRKIDPAAFANGEVDILVNGGSRRFLEVLGAAVGTMVHWKSNLPPRKLALTDS